MAFVVTDGCIQCKFMDCVTVCPVNCFYEGKTMLVIKPDECIDCGSCEPLCPSEAIIADIDDDEGIWVAFNEKYAKLWPRLTERGESPEDSESWIGVEGKLANYFDPSPATRE